MSLPSCTPFGDCEFHKLSLEQKINFLLVDDGSGCPGLKTVGVIPSSHKKADLTKIKEVIKIGSGNIYGWNFINPNAFDIFIKIYDGLTAGVTVGTNTPIQILRVPASGSLYQSPNCVQLSCATGIIIAATKFVAETDTTDVTAVYSTILYK